MATVRLENKHFKGFDQPNGGKTTYLHLIKPILVQKNGGQNMTIDEIRKRHTLNIKLNVAAKEVNLTLDDYNLLKAVVNASSWRVADEHIIAFVDYINGLDPDNKKDEEIK